MPQAPHGGCGGVSPPQDKFWMFEVQKTRFLTPFLTNSTKSSDLRQPTHSQESPSPTFAPRVQHVFQSLDTQHYCSLGEDDGAFQCAYTAHELLCPTCSSDWNASDRQHIAAQIAVHRVIGNQTLGSWTPPCADWAGERAAQMELVTDAD